MKKILSILLVLMILVGCSSNSSTQITNKDEVLFKIEDEAVTKGDVYSMLRYQQIGQIIINDAQAKLVESKIELTDDLKQEAQTMLDESKSQLGEFFATYYGDSDDETLIETVFLPATQQKKFLENYFAENQDSIIEEAKPKKVVLLTYETQETAQQVIDKLNAGSSLEDIITEFGANNNAGFNTARESVLAESNLPTVVVDFLNSDEGKTKEYSKTPLVDASGTKYYVVKLVEDNASVLVDEYKASFLTDQAAANKVMVEYFKNANFEVYDQAIYDGIKATEQLKDFFPNN